MLNTVLIVTNEKVFPITFGICILPLQIGQYHSVIFKVEDNIVKLNLKFILMNDMHLQLIILVSIIVMSIVI